MLVWISFFLIPALFYFVFEHETYDILYECQLCLIFIAARKLTIKLSVKTLKTRTVHFVSSLEIFFFPHVTITSITALGVFANVCLVLLLLLAGSLVLARVISELQYKQSWSIKDFLHSNEISPRVGTESQCNCVCNTINQSRLRFLCFDCLLSRFATPLLHRSQITNFVSPLYVTFFSRGIKAYLARSGNQSEHRIRTILPKGAAGEIIIVIIDKDNGFYGVFSPSDRLYLVYYKVRQVLLRSNMMKISPCDAPSDH